MRALGVLSAAAILTVSTLARAEDGGPRFSLGLERVASLNAVFFSVDQGEEEFGLRAKGFTAGGPTHNPLSAPRLTFDYLASSGLTLGVGLAFGLGDLDTGHNESDDGGLNLLMLNPRVGYRLPLGHLVDLTPRVGATLGWASLAGPEQQSCGYSYDPETGMKTKDCSEPFTAQVNMAAAVANLEIAAAFRATDSFNILTGVSYNLLVVASAQPSNGDSDESSESFSGHSSSFQLWIGLGSYL